MSGKPPDIVFTKNQLVDSPKKELTSEQTIINKPADETIDLTESVSVQDENVPDQTSISMPQYEKNDVYNFLNSSKANSTKNENVSDLCKILITQYLKNDIYDFYNINNANVTKFKKIYPKIAKPSDVVSLLKYKPNKTRLELATNATLPYTLSFINDTNVFPNVPINNVDNLDMLCNKIIDHPNEIDTTQDNVLNVKMFVNTIDKRNISHDLTSTSSENTTSKDNLKITEVEVKKRRIETESNIPETSLNTSVIPREICSNPIDVRRNLSPIMETEIKRQLSDKLALNDLQQKQSLEEKQLGVMAKLYKNNERTGSNRVLRSKNGIKKHETELRNSKKKLASNDEEIGKELIKIHSDTTCQESANADEWKPLILNVKGNIAFKMKGDTYLWNDIDCNQSSSNFIMLQYDCSIKKKKTKKKNFLLIDYSVDDFKLNANVYNPVLEKDEMHVIKATSYKCVIDSPPDKKRKTYFNNKKDFLKIKKSKSADKKKPRVLQILMDEFSKSSTESLLPIQTETLNCDNSVVHCFSNNKQDEINATVKKLLKDFEPSNKSQTSTINFKGINDNIDEVSANNAISNQLDSENAGESLRRVDDDKLMSFVVADCKTTEEIETRKAINKISGFSTNIDMSLLDIHSILDQLHPEDTRTSSIKQKNSSPHVDDVKKSKVSRPVETPENLEIKNELIDIYSDTPCQDELLIHCDIGNVAIKMEEDTYAWNDMDCNQTSSNFIMFQSDTIIKKEKNPLLITCSVDDFKLKANLYNTVVESPVETSERLEIKDELIKNHSDTPCQESASVNEQHPLILSAMTNVAYKMKDKYAWNHMDCNQSSSNFFMLQYDSSMKRKKNPSLINCGVDDFNLNINFNYFVLIRDEMCVIKPTPYQSLIDTTPDVNLRKRKMYSNIKKAFLKKKKSKSPDEENDTASQTIIDEISTLSTESLLPKQTPNCDILADHCFSDNVQDETNAAINNLLNDFEQSNKSPSSAINFEVIDDNIEGDSTNDANSNQSESVQLDSDKAGETQRKVDDDELMSVSGCKTAEETETRKTINEINSFSTTIDMSSLDIHSILDQLHPEDAQTSSTKPKNSSPNVNDVKKSNVSSPIEIPENLKFKNKKTETRKAINVISGFSTNIDMTSLDIHSILDQLYPKDTKKN